MPEKTYDVVQVEKDLMIPMRDGVKMATDIYRPFIKDESEPAKLPILLHRTPYDKTARSAVEQAKYFAQHGQCVQEGPSHPPGHLEQQLSAVRRQPEHRRADRDESPRAGRRQLRLS
jgi:hypothetical protein